MTKDDNLLSKSSGPPGNFPPNVACAGPNDAEPADRLVSRRFIAKRWDCSRKKLDNDFCAGRLPIDTICIGRLRRHRLSDVIAYERAQSRRSSSDKGGMNG